MTWYCACFPTPGHENLRHCAVGPGIGVEKAQEVSSFDTDSDPDPGGKPQRVEVL